MDPPDLAPLNLSDSEDELFDTPGPARKTHKAQSRSRDVAEGAAAAKTRGKESHYTTEEAREAALKQELESVRNVNKVIEGVVDSLQKARDNMDTVSRTVYNATTLLQTWTRILSQTEHNQRLILNPQWQGASQDLVETQNEEIQRQQASHRRAAEEQSRREAAERRAEEERRRAEAPPAARGTTRGRGRGTVKPRASTSSGYGVSGQSGRGLTRSGSTSTRGTSGIGRGVRGSTRGRGLS